MTTVDEIRALVRLTTMVDSGEVADAQLLTWINECIYDISMRGDWPWLETNDTFATVATQQAYTLASISTNEMQEILFVIRSGKQFPIQHISQQEAFARWGDDFPDGDPTWYYVAEEKVNLIPVPSGVETIKVFFVKPPTELTQGSDTFAWIGTFHNLVSDFVEGKAWQQQEDFQKAQVAFNRYFDRLDEMRRMYATRENDAPWAVGAARDVRSGQNTPFQSDWGLAGP